MQTKPLRAYGIDVTQNTMQPILQSIGINDRTVKELSQGEKQILRYIAVLRQGEVAMGDLADTIESPSNQLKVFRQQLVEAKVALSNLFMGTFANILPYANALLMVIKEVSYAIASMFGIELTDYNTSISSGKDAMEDLGGSIDNATGKAKELKRQLLSFDQVHNLNENKDSGGAGGAISGGIDQRLLDAIYSYDNGMSKVRMKATQIRDRIMEWLGFTKEIDKETGNVYFKFNGSNTTMGKILKSLKGIVEYGNKAIKNVFNIIKKDFDNGLFGKVVVFIFQTIEKTLKFIAQNKTAATIIAKIAEAFVLWKTVIHPLVTIIGTLKTAFNAAKMSMKEFVTDFSKHTNTIQGKVGAWGLLAASLLNFGKTIKEGYEGMNIAKNWNENAGQRYLDSINEMREATKENVAANLALSNSHQELISELNEIIDNNGKVKEGYETRANTILTILNKAYGTEYKLVGNQITQNGKIAKSYKEIKDNIQKLIDKKKIEIFLHAFEEDYMKALSRRKEITKDINKRQQEYNETYANYLTAIETGRKVNGKSASELLSSLEKQEKGLEKLHESYAENSKDINAYNLLLEGSIEDNMGKVNTAMKFYNAEQDELIKNSAGNIEFFETTLETKFDDTAEGMVKSADVSSSSIKEKYGKKIDEIKQKFLGLNKLKINVKIGVNMSAKITSFVDEFKQNLERVGIKTNAQGGVYNNGSWSNIPQYASGGIPNRGSMFIAGEAGAEIVGNINGRTEVLNKSQIASAIYSAVKSAMSETGGKDAIEIYAHTDEGVVIDRINRKTKQTGVCPIEMPLG